MYSTVYVYMYIPVYAESCDQSSMVVAKFERVGDHLGPIARKRMHSILLEAMGIKCEYISCIYVYSSMYSSI